MTQLMLKVHPRRPTARRAAVGPEIVVDSFSGGGGASLGIEKALGRCVDVAVNHDMDAIAMHQVNHPATHHVTEDLWKLDPHKATGDRPIGLLWSSPDCTFFSRAKGGKPMRDGKKIRSLAWIVVKWCKEVRPRVVILENVREFEMWGPLTAQSLPCPHRKGHSFKRWIGRLRSLGYDVEWRTLNASAYGAPTHRKRLFLIARCDGRPIVWPGPTHGPGLLPFHTAAECIDWSIPCPSIFLSKTEGRKIGVIRPLAPKTMRRIAMGLKRYVLDNPTPFIISVNHGGPEFRGQPIDHPLGTVTASRRGHAVVAPTVMHFRGDSAGSPATDPLPTVTSGSGASRPAGAAHALGLMAANLVQYNQEKSEGESRGQSPDSPLNTIPTENRFGLVASFLHRYYGNSVGQPVTEPNPTESQNGHSSVVSATFLAKHYGGVVGHPPDRSLGTITAADHHSACAATLVHMNHGDKQWSPCDEPLRTVTSGNHAALVYAFLTKYSGNLTTLGQLADAPLQTITAKDRFGVVTVTIDGTEYLIADIGMRMLRPRELARAQGFPDEYELTGSNATQVAMIGNSVCPQMAEALVRANCSELAAKEAIYA